MTLFDLDTRRIVSIPDVQVYWLQKREEHLVGFEYLCQDQVGIPQIDRNENPNPGQGSVLEWEIGRRTCQPVGKGIGSLHTSVDTLSRSN